MSSTSFVMVTEMLVGLQYLRAYAAFLVLIFHSALLSDTNFVFGAGGVDIFFVLSGFLMWIITDQHTLPKSFLINRIVRIIPLYWLVTFTMFVLESIGLSDDPHTNLSFLIASLLFIPHHFPTATSLYPLVTAGWTLNFEMFFYAVFALTLYINRRWSPWILTFVFGTLSIAGFFLEPQSAVAKFYLNNITLEFVFGVWLGVVWERNCVLPISWAILFSLLGATTICFSHLIPGPRFLVYGIPSLCLVAGMLGLEKYGGFKKLPFLKLLGDASYSTYLWHAMAIAAAAMVSKRLGMDPMSQFFLFLIVGMAVGIVSFVAIERPLMQLKRHYLRKPIAIAPSLPDDININT